MSYKHEQEVAVAAVLKACDVAQATFQKLVNDETVTKKDKSPVTGLSKLFVVWSRTEHLAEFFWCAS